MERPTSRRRLLGAGHHAPPLSRCSPHSPFLLLICLLLSAARLPARAAAIRVYDPKAPCNMVCKDRKTNACPGFPPGAHMREPNEEVCFCGTWPNVTVPACELYVEGPQWWILVLGLGILLASSFLGCGLGYLVHLADAAAQRRTEQQVLALQPLKAQQPAAPNARQVAPAPN